MSNTCCRKAKQIYYIQLNMFNDYESVALNFIYELAAYEGISISEFLRSECKGYGSFCGFDLLKPFKSISFYPNHTCNIDGNIIDLRCKYV